MVFVVDIQVKKGAILLVRNILRDLLEGLKDNNLNNSLEIQVQNNLNIFFDVIEYVVSKKMMKLDRFDLQHYSEDNALIGKSVNMEEQIKVLTSVVKVIFHNIIINKKSYTDIEDFNSNLVVSLCVVNITCEEFPDLTSSNLKYYQDVSKDQFQKNIEDILNGSIIREPQNETKELELRLMNFHIFFNRESSSLDEFPENIIDEFSHIYLDDPKENSKTNNFFHNIDYQQDSSEEENENDNTLVQYPEIDAMFSKQTLMNTNISLLPSEEFNGIWESLHFDSNLKQRLFSYATISLKIANMNKMQSTRYSTITNNKLLLLIGPAGTGKTSICKALCQKLAIRLHKFNDIASSMKGVLIELQCSKIFSKWFGESTKNLTTIFLDVRKLLDHFATKNIFVCLFIDEVEAIAVSRSSLLNKNENMDSMKVVSTLLTNLDQLKKYNNCIVLATSNLLESLDPAFRDRADAIFYVGIPSVDAILQILNQSIKELISRGILILMNPSTDPLHDPFYKEILRTLAKRCNERKMSGRMLEKLPLRCLSESLNTFPIEFRIFLIALSRTISKYEA